MAQVRKFQEGGVLKINGKTYTPDQINEYINQAGLSSQERAALAGTINAIASGQSRTLDRNANSISGVNVTDDFINFYGSEKRAEKNATGRSNRWSNRQARKKSDFHIANTAISKLGGIEDYYNKKKEEKFKTSNKLGIGSGWFDRDEKGNYISGPSNLLKEKHIRQIYDHLSNADKYDLDSTLESNMNALATWYKEGMDAQDLIDAIKKGELTAEQLDVLRLMGYTQSDVEKEQSNEDKVKQAFSAAGYDYDKFRPYFDIDDSGVLIARRTEDGKSVFAPLGGSGNYYFNDSFVKANKDYDFLGGHFLIGDKLYKESDASVVDSDLYKYLRSTNGFYDLNKSGDWEGANGIIRHFWGNETNHRLASDTDVYSKFLYDNPTYRWASLTGAYDVPLNEGEQLIEYYDPNDPTDAFGYGIAKYAILDKDGNFVRNVDSIGNPNGNVALALNGKKYARTEGGDSIYDGMVINDIVDNNNEYSGKTYFQDPKTGDFIYKGRIRGASGIEGNIKIPSKIAAILNTNPKFWNNLVADPILQKRFEATLGDLVNTGFRSMFTNVLSEDEWKKLGFTAEGQAAELVRLFSEFASNKHSGDKIERRQKRIVGEEKLLRNGGLIASKFAPGGSIKSTETKAHTAKKVDSEFKNPENFAKIGKDKFTGQDWAELIALGTDIGAIVAGATGAPIVSGVVGAAGSLTSFGADVSRDGLDWGDVGSLVTNLGLDAVSLLPVAGTAGQSIKAVKAIRKAAPIVLKALAFGGAGDAIVTAAKKIINGEDWNIRDVRNVTNALSGVLALRKTGLLNTGTKTPKVEKKTIAIDKKDVEGLSGDSLKKKIAENFGVKPEDIKSHTTTPEQKRSLKFWKGKQPTGKELFKIESKESIPDKIDLNTRSGQKTRYNDWLKTGEWVDNYAVNPGRAERIVEIPTSRAKMINPSRIKQMPVEVEGKEVYRVLSSARPADIKTFGKPLTSAPKSILKQASIYTPNFVVEEDDRNVELPEWYTSAPKAQYIRGEFLKDGGIVTKQDGGRYPTLAELEDPNYVWDLGEIEPAVAVADSRPSSPVLPELDAVVIEDEEAALPEVDWGNSLNIPKNVWTAPKTKSQGNAIISDTPVMGGGWLKPTSDILGTFAKSLSAYNASKKQLELAKQMDVPLQITPVRTSFRYKDPGIDTAYDRAINQQRNYANNFISSDAMLNAAVGLQTADKVAQLELDRGLKKAEVFGQQLASHEAKLQEQFSQDAEIANANRRAIAAKHNALLQQQGAYIAQNQGITQGFMSDITGVSDNINAGKKALAQFDAQNAYNDEMAKLREQWQEDIKSGKVNENMSFDDWARSKPEVLTKIRNARRNALALQYSFKKGGKIRSSLEQIRIDNEKARHKAIAQLSKQAFELLKIALK